MPQTKINIGNEIPFPIRNNQIVKTLFLTNTGVIGQTNEYNFISGNVTYFSKVINQSFEYILIDNVGEGHVRIAFNKLGLDLTNPTDGAKTLKPGDVLYINDSIRQLSIYYIETSTVEIMLMSE